MEGEIQTGFSNNFMLQKMRLNKMMCFNDHTKIMKNFECFSSRIQKFNQMYIAFMDKKDKS